MVMAANEINNIDLENTYWSRVTGYVTELKIDARWILHSNIDDKPCGSLRIASFPDVRPGFLRAYFMYMVSTRKKSDSEQIQATIDYEVSLDELEVYSIDEDIKTDVLIHDAPVKELQDMFGVNIFKK